MAFTSRVPEVVSGVITLIIGTELMAAISSVNFVPPIERFVLAYWPGALAMIPLFAGLTGALVWQRRRVESGKLTQPIIAVKSDSTPSGDYLSDWSTTILEWREMLLATQETAVGTKDDGGFQSHLYRRPAVTQTLTSAQCVAAVLSASSTNRGGITAKEADSARRAAEFIERMRIGTRQKPDMESASKGDGSPARDEPEGNGWGFNKGDLVTVSEISAWILIAKALSLRTGLIWTSPPEIQLQVTSVIRDLTCLAKRQEAKGGWVPIYHVTPENVRTYSTAMAVWSFAEALQDLGLREHLRSLELYTSIKQNVDNGVRWLLETHQSGWVPNPNRQHSKPSPGLSAQIIYILSRAEKICDVLRTDLRYGSVKKEFLLDAKIPALDPDEPDADFQVSNVDAWVDLPDREQFLLEPMSFLWYPWSVVAYECLANDRLLGDRDRQLAQDRQQALLRKYAAAVNHVKSHGETFVLAEHLLCLGQIPKLTETTK
jgi:hypothetical protein